MSQDEAKAEAFASVMRKTVPAIIVLAVATVWRIRVDVDALTGSR